MLKAIARARMITTLEMVTVAGGSQKRVTIRVQKRLTHIDQLSAEGHVPLVELFGVHAEEGGEEG